MNLRTGESAAALAELVDQLEASLKGHDSTWGPTFEDPNVTIGILGWDSKEVSSCASGIQSRC